MSFPRYGAYKDSGVKWLGEVPAHWMTPPLYMRYTSDLGKMLDASRITGDHSIPYLRNIDVQWGVISFEDLPEMDINPSEYPRYTIKPGDLMVCEGGEVGRAAIVPDTGAVIGFQKALHRLRSLGDSEHPGFMYYTLAWASAYGVFSLSGMSTIAHLTGEQLRKYRFPKPPLAEQTAIAIFLDRETAKIDELVAEQQNLIALLKEKRQALISHAVTKGLDPAAPMKDSGVEWLGEVPAHWAMTRLRVLFRQEKRQDQVGKCVLSVYRDYGVVLKESRDDNMNKTPEDLSAYQLVNPNDLVVNKMKAWQGSLGISDFEGITSPDYIVFAPRHRECPAFLHLLLRSARMVTVYRSVSNGIRPAQWRLEPDLFLRLPIFLPPVHEQRDLVSSTTERTSRFDILSGEAEATIALLQERRTALISAAVTGKIDVRTTINQELTELAA